MNRKYTTLITASVLALAAASATGQIQTDSPRQSLQIAERLMQERAGLYSAIAIAETHTKGVAIGVRLSMDQNLFSHRESGGLGGRTIGHTSDLDEADRREADRARQPGQQQQQQQREQQQREQQQQRSTDQDRQTDRQQDQTRTADRDRQTGQQQQRTMDQDRQTGQRQDQRGAQSGPLFAIVTCVVDRTRVRDVVIDMQTNTVIGVQTATFRGSEQAGIGQRSQDDRDYRSDYDREYDSPTDASRFARASDLMNATVRNTAGKKLGDIDELAIDPDSNRVVYGVLRRGGFLGMGESRYAVPSSELTPLRNGRIVLDLNEDHFKNISGFDNNNWPTRAESTLRSSRTTTQAVEIPTARRVVKASSVIGNNVQCRDGHKLGEIADLVVDGRSGRVLYAIVKADRGHMAVPMATMKKTEKAYTLPMSMDQLRSMPMLDTNRDPNWSDESWNRRIHESYGARFETTSTRDSR
jgi:sporulation protein YlmC with PRC-barrel domain